MLWLRAARGVGRFSGDNGRWILLWHRASQSRGDLRPLHFRFRRGGLLFSPDYAEGNPDSAFQTAPADALGIGAHWMAAADHVAAAAASADPIGWIAWTDILRALYPGG